MRRHRREGETGEEMTDLAHECARQIFDVTPTVIQAIRFEMRSLRLTDLTVPQFRTLAFINNHPGASLSDAAEFIGLTLSSMSILVNGLVERGLVQREPGLADRRRVHLSLTDAGLVMFRNVRTGTQDRLAEMVGKLSDEQQRTIVQAMELLRPIFLPRSLNPPASAAAQQATDAAPAR
jgi:DNA-binding MarR family transcriptional regulator